MIIVPVICNAIQYWVTDSFIKSKKQAVAKTTPQKSDLVKTSDQTFCPFTASPSVEEADVSPKKSDKSLLLDHED